jgi:hypothetical protein
MSEQSNEILYSEDGETFYPGFGDMLDRLESNGELEVGRKYETCEARTVTTADLRMESLAGYVMENIDERLGDLRCLAEDEYPCDDVPAEGKAELAELLAGWVERNVLAGKNYSRLLTGTVKEHEITKQDVADFTKAPADKVEAR